MKYHLWLGVIEPVHCLVFILFFVAFGAAGLQVYLASGV